MKNRSSRKGSPSSMVSGLMALAGVIASLTLLRLAVATGGSMTGEEALLAVCAEHPAGGYVEGPAGVPLLLAVVKWIDHAAGDAGWGLLRWIPSLALVPLTACVWWITRRLIPYRPTEALWAALFFNLLPPVNLAALVMNGAVLTALFPMLAGIAGWRAVTSPHGHSGRWVFFGVVLGVATMFWQWSGLLLPAAAGALFVRQGWSGLSLRSFAAALGGLLLGWVPSLSWNAKHDWIQWSGVAAGFDHVSLLGAGGSLGVILMACALAVPLMVSAAFSGRVARVAVILAGAICAAVTTLIFAAPASLPHGLPSPLGVSGIPDVARSVRSLRAERPGPKGGKPFLIAESPGLASLLGTVIAVVYPERPGAPSVFAAESPGMVSSYAFWPSYADAVVASVKDVLYTEEKSASPFLGRNALYVTTETKEELPQTITGAFGAVGLLAEIPVKIDGRSQLIRIYQCEAYRTLSL